MAYVQNKDRDGKLKSGPMADYSKQAEEAQEKDRKNQEEALKLRFEQERNMQEAKMRQRETLERVKIYKERKRAKMANALGKGYGQIFRSRSGGGMSGTEKARMGRHEGGSTAKG